MKKEQIIETLKLMSTDENEYYQNPWNDYVMSHSMVFEVEA